MGRSRGLDQEIYTQMALGKWAWSGDGETHDHYIVFRDDHACSFLDLENTVIEKFEGECKWGILMKSLKLKMSVPQTISGGFIQSNRDCVDLNRKRGVYNLEMYEEIVAGKWSWSSDGLIHDSFIVLADDHTCEFQNLDGVVIGPRESEGPCTWTILMKHNTLKLDAPHKYVGGFIEPNVDEAKITR
jgi:hypothetical protein